MSIGLGVVLAATLMIPAPVAAFSVGSSKIIHSVCSTAMPWTGDVPYDNASDTYLYQSVGTVKQCTYFYKATDGDPQADYYVVMSRATWTVQNDSFRGDNRGYIQLESNTTTQDWDADPDHNVLSSGSCADISVGLNFYFVSVGVSQRLCSGGKLNLETFSSKLMQWGSPDVTNTPRWETAYTLKVAQGKKPTLSSWLFYPSYSIYRDPNTLYWKYTKHWAGHGQAYKVP